MHNRVWGSVLPIDHDHGFSIDLIEMGTFLVNSEYIPYTVCSLFRKQELMVSTCRVGINMVRVKGPCPVACPPRTLSKLSESTESACQGQHAVCVDMGVVSSR